MTGDGSARPTLVVFTSSRDGRSRRAEAFLSQVLQRRRNHDTFNVRHVVLEERPDLHQKFGIEQMPTIVVVAERRVLGRLQQPRGCTEIQTFLAPWLQ